MDLWTLYISFAIWFIFIFISVVWILMMFKHKPNMVTKVRKMKKFPRVSVLIPAYNEENTIAKTVKSVLNLDYPRKMLDIIIINDASTDGTKKISEGFRKFGVRVLTNRKNSGSAANLSPFGSRSSFTRGTLSAVSRSTASPYAFCSRPSKSRPRTRAEGLAAT